MNGNKRFYLSIIVIFTFIGVTAYFIDSEITSRQDPVCNFKVQDIVKLKINNNLWGQIIHSKNYYQTYCYYTIRFSDQYTNGYYEFEIENK